MMLLRLLASLFLVEGWVSPSPLSSFRIGRTRIALQEQNNAFFEDEECFDLCELDEDDVTMPLTKKGPIPVDYKIALNLKQLTRHEKELQAETDRMRLEMTYEMFRSTDDCDLEDVSTCSEKCKECHGAGHTLCRCCAGRKQVSLIPNNSMSCPVCSAKGVEECNKCHGSGWIAKWTELSDFKPEL